VQPVEEWERGVVGFDFAETGAMIAERWLFPFQTCDVIRCQLNPEMAVIPVSLLSALQFTRRLLELTGTDFAAQDWLVAEDDPYVKAAGLTPTFIDRMVTDCQEKCQAIQQAVSV
jgi:HD-like signal output (HDOD) protein